MKLIQRDKTHVKQSTSKKAVDHFKRCPLCGDADLIRVSPEVICSQCDWNSCLWSVSRGRMDNLHAAVIEDLRESGRGPTLVRPSEVREDEDIHLDITAGGFR